MSGKVHLQGVAGSYMFPWFDEFHCTGDLWWVGSSVTGATDGTTYGRTPEAPFATLAYAISQATASNHDRIAVMPGHTETITAAAGVNVNKAGLHILGLGRGRNRPVVNYTTAAGASFDINSANTTVENIVFTPTGVASVTAAVNVKAADVMFLNCEFEHANSTNQAVLVILTTAAANRLVVDNCFFHGSNNAGTTSAIKIVGTDASRIRDCIFEGAYSASAGVVQTSTTDATNLVIERCTFSNYTAVNTKSIVATAATTGFIRDCTMQILSGTAPITGAAMSWCGRNYYAATIATGSTLV